MKIYCKSFLAFAFAAFALSLVCPSIKAQADTKAMSSMSMHAKKMAQAYYVCNSCQVYYSSANAKKLGYKDQMGHKLVKVSKVPAGYGDGMKM